MAEKKRTLLAEEVNQTVELPVKQKVGKKEKKASVSKVDEGGRKRRRLESSKDVRRPLLQGVSESIEWAGRKLTLETGRMARQATGAVLATYGETMVLCTVVGVEKAMLDASFFPLSVHYQEKTFAVGEIPSGFLKRESKPSEKEVLVSRLIDRPIRPLFPEGFLNEVQVVCTVLSYDRENDSDIVAMIGASAALSLSGVPFLGPIGGVRVGYCEGGYKINPTPEELTRSAMDLVVAGTEHGVLMVESEIAELDDEIVRGGIETGHKAFQPVIQMIKKLEQRAGKPKWALEDRSHINALKEEVAKAFKAPIQKALFAKDKQERVRALEEAYECVTEQMGEVHEASSLSAAFHGVKKGLLREGILEGKRLDGRKVDEVRAIFCETSLLPRSHGSALFTRGETQALVTATLGSSDDAQLMDTLDGDYKEAFMLHYNFPPYCVGEAGRMGAPGRREVGHGKLAWRALRAVLPAQETFPYTVRLVSEITESNGSSSMATVCGGALALMDAGVSVKRPVAGIAMGLVKEGDRYVTLSDISGDEDGCGDMDFKVARTEKGLTALQMDIKITSVTPGIMKKALAQAKVGAEHILSEMVKELEAHRGELSDHAPRVETLTIDKDKIRDVIGPGGKVIRDICEKTDAKIDIEDDGTVRIFAPSNTQLEAALARIEDLTYEPEVGEIIEGRVANIQPFGAFVEFKTQTGLVHISELADKRVEKVEDVLKMGQEVRAKVIGFDRGKIKLSIKALLGKTDK